MNPHEKIGLYGGSFDPVHHGHLILAREALEQFGLDRVIFIPAGISPHKLEKPAASAGMRCAMLEAAIAGEAAFSWDDCEVVRAGPSYAIDTVRLVRERNPGAEIFYFIGEDNLAGLPTWKDVAALRESARLVVMRRTGAAAVPGFPFVEKRVDISSTDIRNRVASGMSVRYLLPDAAREMMERSRLYRNE